MSVTVDFLLKDYLAAATDVFWAGSQPPFGWFKSSTDIYDPSKDYRMPPDLHQRNQIVYLVEKDISLMKGWPLILDEAMRLLAPGGIIVLRVTNTPLMTIFALKNQISLWGDVEILFEHLHEQGPLTFAIKNKKTTTRSVNGNNFTFGVIATGERKNELKTFISSVLNLQRSEKDNVEVVVCGPKALGVDIKEEFESIVYIDQPDEFTSLGWITKKKNMIVEHAKYENVVIAHDRYRINSDFIKQIKKFGPDFSVLVCRQLLKDGRRIPDWVTLGSAWSLTTPAVMQYGDWSPYGFVNGGIMIAKREVLLKCPWNELLFWHQAEDVEQTRRFTAHGYMPRLARNVVVETENLRRGFLDGFAALPASPSDYYMTGPESAHAEKFLPMLVMDIHYYFNAASLANSFRQGLYIDNAWEIHPDDIFLPPGELGEIVFQPNYFAPESFSLILQGSFSGGEPTAMVNEKTIKINMLNDCCMEIFIDKNLYNTTNIVHIVFDSNAGMRLKSLKPQSMSNSLMYGAGPKYIRLKSKIKNFIRPFLNKYPTLRRYAIKLRDFKNKF